MWSEIERVKIHFRYCVGIMGALLVGALSLRMSEVKGMGDLLANAATMTSLVLGVVAIFYSFISNDSLSRSLGSITTVSGEIRDTREQIGRFLEHTRAASEQSGRDAGTLREASGNIGESLVDLHQTLRSIAEQNLTLQAAIGDVAPRIDKGFAGMAKALGEKAEQPRESVATGASSSSVPDDIVPGLLRFPALGYNLLTLACVLAHRTGKELSIPELCKKLSISLEGGMSGFLQATSGLRVIERDLVEGKPRVYKIKAVHQVLRDTTKDYISGYIERAYKSDPAELERWRLKIEVVEAMFAE